MQAQQVLQHLIELPIVVMNEPASKWVATAKSQGLATGLVYSRMKELADQGLLSQAVEYAANKTAAAESSLIQQGVPAPQAQELMREEWAFLPNEADVPELPSGHPSTWLRTSSLANAPKSPSPESAPESPTSSHFEPLVRRRQSTVPVDGKIVGRTR